ncbi:MAG TPA: P-II family nitrogen regulator [Bacilli bacterium]|nr:P-II family nitrogen regulator [Bacilli bacterium]
MSRINQENFPLRALFVVVNTGFSEQIVDALQEAGSKGATIIPARGTGAKFSQFLGIHYEPEREILLSVNTPELAAVVMEMIKEKFGKDTPMNAVCFTMPVEDATFIK